MCPALPLGIVDAAEYAAVSLHLALGDRLAQYPDGLVEARNASGELLGFDRIRSLLKGGLDADETDARAVAFAQDDDMAVLIPTRQASDPERALMQTLVATRATGRDPACTNDLNPSFHCSKSRWPLCTQRELGPVCD